MIWRRERSKRPKLGITDGQKMLFGPEPASSHEARYPSTIRTPTRPPKGTSRALRPTTTRASTATAPRLLARTGLRSTLEQVRALPAELGQAHDQVDHGGPIDRRATPQTGRGSSPPRRRSSIAPAVARITGASSIATSSRASARTPPSPTRTSSPNWGSRLQPDDQLHPARQHRLDQQAAQVDASRTASADRTSSSAAAVDDLARVGCRPDAYAAETSVLWARPFASSFRTTG